MRAELSVLIATYRGDQPTDLRRAISSIWAQQTVRPSQIVLVVDGPVRDESNAVIAEAQRAIGDALNVVRLPQNSGLSAALNAGLKHCRADLVARMDADDISAPVRFEKQIAFMDKHPDVAVLGSWALEVDRATGETILRRVPENHEDIKRFAKRRNAISHPTAVFRKHRVLGVGGYPNLKIEDYALWAVLLQKGFRFANLSEVLVNMNGGRSLMERRGLRYFLGEIQLFAFQRRIGFLSTSRYLLNLLGRFVTRAVPVPMRALLYKAARG